MLLRAGRRSSGARAGDEAPWSFGRAGKDIRTMLVGFQPHRNGMTAQRGRRQRLDRRWPAPLRCRDGAAPARPHGDRAAGGRTRHVAGLRPPGGPAVGGRRGRRRCLRRRRARRRFLADVRPRGGRPLGRPRHRRAARRGVRRDQGVDQLGGRWPAPLHPPARLVRRPRRPAPGPQPARLARAPRVDGGRAIGRERARPGRDDVPAPQPARVQSPFPGPLSGWPPPSSPG